MDDHSWLQYGSNQYINAIVNTEPPEVSIISRADQPTLDEIRKIIREEVQNALHPALGTVDVMHFLTVEATDETGKRWKGVLYAIEEEKE